MYAFVQLFRDLLTIFLNYFCDLSASGNMKIYHIIYGNALDTLVPNGRVLPLAAFYFALFEYSML